MELFRKGRPARSGLLLGFLFLTAPWCFSQEMPLTELVQKAQMTLWWDSWRETGLVRLGQKTAALHPGEKIALIQGEKILELPGLRMTKAGPVLTLQDWDRLWEELKKNDAELTRPRPGGGDPRIGVIVVDPGHGGRDPGAESTYEIQGKRVRLQEKNINLTVALELERLFQKGNPDQKIVLTRRDDSYPTLEDRVSLAHSLPLAPGETILFVSLHVNASLNTAAQGVEVWYIPSDYQRDVLRPEDPSPEPVKPILNDFQEYEFKVESRRLAQLILKNLEKSLGQDFQDRGLKENPWFVVRMAKMPAVLVELGFITNPQEAARLQNPEYLNKLAEGIYTGLRQFILEYETPEALNLD